MQFPRSQVTIRFAELIRGFSKRNENDAPPPGLLLWSDRVKQLECYYAPFEYLNEGARIVLVGITPGPSDPDVRLPARCKAVRHIDPTKCPNVSTWLRGQLQAPT